MRALMRARHVVVGLFVATLAGCSCEEPDSFSERTPELAVDQGTPDPTEPGRWLIDFGEVAIGGARAREIVVKNQGAAPLTLAPATLEAPFSTLQAEPLVLESSASVAVGFVFSPTVAGGASVSIAVPTDGGTLAIRLVGVGVPPALTCTPSSLDFGRVARGATIERTTSCTNDSPGTILFDPVASGEGFTYLGEGARELRTGESFDVTVAFTPTSTGPHAGMLEFLDAARTSVGGVPLSGEGILSALQVDPDVGCPGLVFGFTPEGVVAEQSFTLRNAGTEPLTIDELSISGSNDFGLSPTGSFTLPADDAGTPGREDERLVTVRFTPTGVGRRAASITVRSDDPSSPEREICVEGAAGGPVVRCTPGAMDFGVVTPLTTSTRQLVCTNEGTDDPSTLDDRLIVSQAVVQGAAFGVRLPEGLRPEGYGVGESFRVELTFTPPAEELYVGALTIESNTVPATVALSGNGGTTVPCVLEATPPMLGFGVLTPHQTATRAIGFRAVQPPCRIGNVTLEPGSHPGYGTDVWPGETTLASPDAQLVFGVTLDAGNGAESFQGAVIVTEAGTGAILTRVPLAAGGCLAVDAQGQCEAATQPAYVHDAKDLSSFDPAPGTTAPIGRFDWAGGTTPTITDVAIDRTGTMFAVGGAALFRVDPRDATLTFVGDADTDAMGLTALPDGRLVLAADGLVVLDPGNANVVRQLVPAGLYVTAGDVIGLPDGFLYWSVEGATNDLLIRVDPSTGATLEVGDLGEAGVFGLGFAYGELFGFTRAGEVITIDPANAAILQRRTVTTAYWGAATNPVLW